MGYKYSALHNTILHDGNDTDDRVIEDGGRVRVPLTLMDSTQLAIAQMDVSEYDNVELVSRQEMADWDKAELSARWKGGLAEGDRVRIGDKLMVVSGRNPTNGKVVLRDASTSASDAETRQNMYDEYDNDIQSRYLTTHDAKAGDACTTAGREAGVWRERAKDGRLVCVPGGKPDQWALAGPLSDAERVKVVDEAYSDYDAQIQNAWRK